MLTNCVISTWSFIKLLSSTHMLRLFLNPFLAQSSVYGFTRSSYFMQLALGSLSCSVSFFQWKQKKNANYEFSFFFFLSLGNENSLSTSRMICIQQTSKHTHKLMWLFFISLEKKNIVTWKHHRKVKHFTCTKLAFFSHRI